MSVWLGTPSYPGSLGHSCQEQPTRALEKREEGMVGSALGFWCLLGWDVWQEVSPVLVCVFLVSPLFRNKPLCLEATLP